MNDQWARFDGLRVTPFQNTVNGPWIMAQVRSSVFSGVAEVDLETAQVKPIDAFEQSTYQAGGTFDGVTAVWKEYRSPSGLDDFVVKEWSAERRVVTIVGRSHMDSATGRVWPSPWIDPTVAEGYAAWVEGTGANGRGDLVVLDTVSGTKRNFSTGHPGGDVLIYRGNLLWPESTRPGAQTRIFAKDLDAGNEVAPPAALASQRGIYSLATDGIGLAWVGSDGHALFMSRNGSTEGRPVVELIHGGFNPPTVMARGIVMTTFSGGVIAASSNGVSMRVVRGPGGVSRAGSSFLVGQPNGKKNAHSQGVALVKRSDLPLSTCGADSRDALGE